MEGFLFTIGIPAGLFAIMFGIGLQLVPDDWLRIKREPRGVLAGFLGQFGAMPAIAIAVALLAPLPPDIAIGFIILAACPGGIVSNSFSYLSRGDVALSVTLTAISSVLAVLTLPLIIELGFALGGNNLTNDLRLPLGRTFLQLFLLTILPLATGMVIRRVLPAFAEKADRAFRGINILVLALLFGAVLVTEFDFLLANMLATGTISILLSMACLTAGYLMAAGFNLPRIQRKTIAIETGVQNGSVGIMIATTILQEPAFAIAPAIYGTLSMFVTAGFIVLVFRER